MISPVFTSTAPCPCAAPSLLDDVTNGFLYICSYGTHSSALGFRGDDAFVNRWFNWARNRGVIGNMSRLIRPHQNKTFAYIVVRDREDTTNSKGVSKILRGLAEQFRSEIIMSGEVTPLSECYTEDEGWSAEFDEEKIGVLANERAHVFFTEHVSREDFMRRYTQEGIAPIYETSSPYAGMSQIRSGDED